MQIVRVEAESGCKVFRASIDGVRITTITGTGKSQATRNIPAGWHTLAWDVLGEKDDDFEIKLTIGGDVKCRGEGPLGSNGIDHGSCPFEAF